jgi:PhnB protein
MTTESKTKGETELRQVMNEHTEAVRTKNAEKMTSLYDSGVVMFTLAPPLSNSGIHPRDLQGWFDSWRGNLEYEVRDVRFMVGDDVAFMHNLTRVKGVTAESGESSEWWMRVTMGFRKRDGRWLIAHEHESVPFYMDGSARAAMDLKPQAA